MKRIAVSRLHLPDGTILRNQVVEVLPHTDGQLIQPHAADHPPLVGGGWVDCGPCSARFYPLTEELACTKWFGGDFYWDTLSAELLI